MGPLLSRRTVRLVTTTPFSCNRTGVCAVLLYECEGMSTLMESAVTESMKSASSHIMASPTPASLSQHFVDNKFYLLVVIGEIVTEDHLKCAIAEIEKGKTIDGDVLVLDVVVLSCQSQPHYLCRPSKADIIYISMLV